MTTYIPQPCCLTGHAHTGNPTGTVTTLHNLPVYISEPPSSPPKAIIIYIPDVFGWTIPNARLLVDAYAARTGARVYLPDFMNNSAFPAAAMHALHTVMNASPSILTALYTKTWPFLQALYYVLPRIFAIADKPCRPRVLQFLKGIRENESRELGVKVGVAGFCWGGHHVVDLCTGGAGNGRAVEGVTGKDGRALVDAGFTAHPGNLREVPGDFEGVVVPLSVVVGSADSVLSLEQSREIQRVLEARQEESEERGGQEAKGRFEMEIVPDALHGFATRGNREDELEARQAKVAEDQAVAFFASWLGTNK